MGFGNSTEVSPSAAVTGEIEQVPSRESIPYIYASAISPVPDLVADLGGKVDRLFRECGVPFELASEPEQVVSMRDYFAVLEAAARETGHEHFGVSLGERLEIDDLGPFGRLLTSAPTLHRAIETANALVHHFSPAMSCWLEIENETARWSFRRTGLRDRNEGRRIDGEYCMAVCRALVRLAAGPDWQPSAILLEQATPHQLRALEARLGAPVRRHSDAWALLFPRDLLDVPMTCRKTLDETEQKALRARLKSMVPEDSFVGSVMAIIRSRLSGGYPEISAVARSTDLSVRTFQRRLAEERVVYSHLVADIRRDLAWEMLAGSSRSLLDVSLSLGYSDPANFTRAFRRWTGATPSEFRRASLCAPGAV